MPNCSVVCTCKSTRRLSQARQRGTASVLQLTEKGIIVVEVTKKTIHVRLLGKGGELHAEGGISIDIINHHLVCRDDKIYAYVPGGTVMSNVFMEVDWPFLITEF